MTLHEDNVPDPKPTLGRWPNDHAPIQTVPLTSSTERMHILGENCWCEPMMLASGKGEDFKVPELQHQAK